MQGTWTQKMNFSLCSTGKCYKPTGGVFETKLCISARSCKMGKRSKVIPNPIDLKILTLTCFVLFQYDRWRVVWIELHSMWMCCEVSSRMGHPTKNEACHPIIMVSSKTQSVWSILWYTVSAGYSWTLLESIKNDCNTQTLARSQNVGTKSLYPVCSEPRSFSSVIKRPALKWNPVRKKRKVQHCSWTNL